MAIRAEDIRGFLLLSQAYEKYPAAMADIEEQVALVGQPDHVLFKVKDVVAIVEQMRQEFLMVVLDNSFCSAGTGRSLGALGFMAPIDSGAIINGLER